VVVVVDPLSPDMVVEADVSRVAFVDVLVVTVVAAGNWAVIVLDMAVLLVLRMAFEDD